MAPLVVEEQFITSFSGGSRSYSGVLTIDCRRQILDSKPDEVHIDPVLGSGAWLLALNELLEG